MGGSSTEEEEARLLEEALRVLPEDVLELVKAKPPAERLQLLRALVQAVDVEYGPLTPKEWAAVRSDPERYGFKPSDLPEGLDLSQCAALAARARGADGGRRLAGLLLATLEPLKRARREQVGGSSADGLSDPWARGRGGAPPAPMAYADEDAAAVAAFLSGRAAAGGGGGLQGGEAAAAGVVPDAAAAAGNGAAAAAGGGAKPPKLGLAVQLLGIDYEFRRQGIGGALLDLLEEVADAAGAGALWLWAARHNASGLAFWRGRGFEETPREATSPAGEFVLMVRRREAAEPQRAAGGGGGGSGRPGGFGGGGGGKRRGKRGKAKAVAAVAAAAAAVSGVAAAPCAVGAWTPVVARPCACRPPLAPERGTAHAFCPGARPLPRREVRNPFVAAGASPRRGGLNAARGVGAALRVLG